MEKLVLDLAVVWDVPTAATPTLQTLSELELAIVGGGIGDTVL